MQRALHESHVRHVERRVEAAAGAAGGAGTPGQPGHGEVAEKPATLGFGAEPAERTSDDRGELVESGRGNEQ